ncbi:hypothetical protein [Pleionea litopenaei]|uniref:Uncharacterized protein n=1 Tax=Pleionea litopenaei TaxID=3070815 RepID=A0AA51RS49_9GAMM|nr:hypothetical protein [Pleionea sp. HL-JVS1]WMS86637.1 hypothetical protein Q9312_15555 [Pleionea sp. HL-JVS1]
MKRLVVGCVVFGVGLMLIKWFDLNEEKVTLPYPLTDENMTLSSKKDIKKASNNKASSSVSTKQALQEKVVRLNDCYLSGACNYPNSDPRSYDYALGNDMVKLMDELEMYFLNGELDSDELRLFAHQFLNIDNGHVQAKAIQLLNQLSVDSETLLLVTSTLSNHYDAALLEKSLPLLQAYHQQGFALDVDTLLQQQVQTGGHFIRQMLSGNILPFINNSNVQSYRNISTQMNASSVEFFQLTEALDEFQRLQHGG